MRARVLSIVLALGAILALASPAAASNASCTAQFTSTLAKVARPFGQMVVVPEVRTLALGGPNLGQEVKLLFAQADREACPLTP
jgi:hypothetical protein